MKFFVVVLTLTIAGAIGKANNDGDADTSTSAGGSSEENLQIGGYPRDQGGVNVGVNKCRCKGKKKIPASGEADLSLNRSDDYEGSDETSKVQASYTYKIQVERGDTKVMSNTVVHVQSPGPEDNNIQYYERVDADNPFWIDGSLSYEDSEIYAIPRLEPISSCAEYEDGTWNDLITKVFNVGLTPNGECPVDPGTYTIYRYPPLMKFTTPEKLKCGNYKLLTYANNAKDEWTFQVNWNFTIPNDEWCIPKESQ